MSRAVTQAHGVVDDLDAFVTPTMICVLVFRAWIRVLNLHALDIHGVIFRWRYWSYSTSPILGPFWHTWVPSIPETETNLHWSLGKVIARLFRSERPYHGAVHGPDYRGW